MTDRLKHGQRRSLRLRRIDETRAVVLPAQAAEVIDLRQITHRLARARQEVAEHEQRLAVAKDRVLALETFVREFSNAPIEPDADDPEAATDES